MADQQDKTITRSREETIRLNLLGRQWLKAFFSTLRTIHFHEPHNQIFNDLILSLLTSGGGILDLEGRAEFRVLDDQFFINSLWIKPTLSERANLFSLADVMKKAHLGGITIRSAVSDENWRQFLGIYRDVKSERAERARELNRALGEAGLEQMELHPVFVLRDDSPEELPLPAESYHAVTTYTKALLCLREFAQCAPGEEQVVILRKAQRIACELIEVCEKNPRLFATLSLLKNFDSYFYHHGVNAFVLSLLLARDIGMSRKDLVDLGMAALLHDVGKLTIPEHILEKPGKLTEDEQMMIRRHPIESAKTFLTLGYFNDSVAERALVAYQHHWATRSPDTYPQPRRDMTPSLMSEIVALSVRFDSLSTTKDYRGGFTPWETARILAGEGDRGMYRREILDAFLRLLGPLPVGSWVSLEDGSEGIVATGGSLSPTPPFPTVFVPDGEKSGSFIDTGQVDPKLGKRRRLGAVRPTAEKYHRTLSALFQISENSPLT